MSTILIVGTESVVGANLAARLAESHSVVALGCVRRVEIPDCQCEAAEDDSPAGWIERFAPQQIIFCGSQSSSGWDAPRIRSFNSDTRAAADWATAAAEGHSGFTLVSSNGIFTGPWMFHAEDSHSLCPTAESRAIQNLEERVAACHPEALIVRTHVIGWSSDGDGWAERSLETLLATVVDAFDCVGHSNPISAARLASELPGLWEAGLKGVWHIAGAERINRLQLANRLAMQFGTPCPRSTIGPILSTCPREFGASETSLQTRRLRRRTGFTAPTISDLISDLYAESVDGFRDRLAQYSEWLGRVA